MICRCVVWDKDPEGYKSITDILEFEFDDPKKAYIRAGKLLANNAVGTKLPHKIEIEFQEK